MSPTGSSVLLVTPVDYLSGKDRQMGDKRDAKRTRFWGNFNVLICYWKKKNNKTLNPLTRLIFSECTR